METTYEKSGDFLKIIEPVESTVSMDELLAEQAQVQREMANAESLFNELQAIRTARLAVVTDLIAQAQALQIESVTARQAAQDAVEAAKVAEEQAVVAETPVQEATAPVE